MRRNVMREAWMFVKDDHFTMSEAMQMAWANNELLRCMRIGIVEFRFRKVDGSERIAHGTLRDDMLPTTKGTCKKPHKSVQVYFDTDAGGWRCFKKKQLLKS